jgi:hypothetical protein
MIPQKLQCEVAVRPPKITWADTPESRGVLMFAQLLNEMLASFSFESFRVLSLDTTARLREAVTLVSDVKQGRIPKAAIDPVIAELNWSLQKDPVAKHFAQLEIDDFSRFAKITNPSWDNLTARLLLLQKKISPNYRQALERKLIELVPDSKHRVAFRQVTGFYCSHLVNSGFSKPYLADGANALLQKDDGSSVTKADLRNFFNLLPTKGKKLTLYFLVSHDFGRFLQMLGFDVVAADEASSGASSALKTLPEFTEMPSIGKHECEAFDEYSAIVQTELLLTHVRALTYLDPHGMLCLWCDHYYVWHNDENRGALTKKVAISFERPAPPRMTAGRRLKSIRNYSRRILRNFDQPSTARLLSAIATSALARTSSSTENHLISLWSAIEVLLSDPPQSTPRITHYANTLVPCICLRYIRRQFVAVFEEMVLFHRRKFLEIVESDKNSGQHDAHTNFASIICLPENEAFRKRLCDIASDNPLALHRMWKLQRDFSSHKAVLDAITGHSDRVSWQLHRIYRARNNLVHAGRSPSFLDSLIINLAEYFRASIATIVNRARKEDKKSDLNQMVLEIGIQYEIFFNYFKEHKDDADMTRTDLMHLMN